MNKRRFSTHSLILVTVLAVLIVLAMPTALLGLSIGTVEILIPTYIFFFLFNFRLETKFSLAGRNVPWAKTGDVNHFHYLEKKKSNFFFESRLIWPSKNKLELTDNC